MSSEQYEPGERVRVVMEGMVAVGIGADFGLSFRGDDLNTVIFVPVSEPGVTVERLAPPEPEWWERRGPGMVVAASHGRVWLHTGAGVPDSWVGDHGLRQSDAGMLELGPLTLLHDPSTPADPAPAVAHTWPPTEAGLWYEDREGDLWQSVPAGDEPHGEGEPERGLIMACVEEGHRVTLRRTIAYTAERWGPMDPIPAPARTLAGAS